MLTTNSEKGQLSYKADSVNLHPHPEDIPGINLQRKVTSNEFVQPFTAHKATCSQTLGMLFNETLSDFRAQIKPVNSAR